MKITSLNGVWKLKCFPYKQEEPAYVINGKVPGNVQLDLSESGYLPEDLFMGNNILKTEELEGWDFEYEREFDFEGDSERAYLVFEGVDTFADYYLNGELIGYTENMLVEHEFYIGNHLKQGKNTLTVHITSPVAVEYEKECDMSTVVSWFKRESNSCVRRAAHTYGWDIMPRAVTSGIWRGVRIEERDVIRFSQIYCRTTDESVRLYFDLDGLTPETRGLSITVKGACGDSSFEISQKLNHTKAFTLFPQINDPKRWMPYGYGDPNVYDCKATLFLNGEMISEKEFSFGLRTVVLDRTDRTDGVSGKFRFLVNGTEIMCKGSNWVPLDAFHSRDAERYADAMALVSDIGCNILRCWGGNVYEDTEFYDYCDRHGIMIWQDFGMACHSYPRTDDFKKTLEDEVCKVVKKLRNHPCVILWSGDNEVDEMKFSLGEDPSYNVITRNWLPEFIRRHDIDRPYLPSSPYIGPGVKRSEVSESHQWGPRDYFKSDFYKKNTAHFISETGYHGCPSPESIRRFITADKVWPYENNDEWILHSTDQNGDDGRVMLMEKQIRYLFGIKPDNLEDYAEASQISQAEAKKYFIERMRVGRPYKTGVIWWNLLDGWPQLSDAIVDYYFVKKLAYSYIKRTQAPFSIISDEADDEGMLSVYACNDSLDAPKGRFEIINAENGETVVSGEFKSVVNGNVLLARVPAVQNRMYIFRWSTDRGDGFNHYYCGNIPLDIEAYKSQAKKYGVM